MTEQRVRVEDRGAVRWVIHQRTAKKNAFDFASADEMWRAIERADNDDAVRVVVVAADGDYFSAGADVHLFLHHGTMEPSQLLRVSRLYDAVRDCEKPIVAMVQGHAVGMGVTMLPHFDLVYADTNATFTTPFVKLGLVLEFGSSYTLSRLIGVQRAKELILSARPLDARTACEWGLVTRVFDAAHLESEVDAVTQAIAESPPSAVAAAKRLIDAGLSSSIENAIRDEDDTLALRYGSPENVEAVTAILSKKGRAS